MSLSLPHTRGLYVPNVAAMAGAPGIGGNDANTKLLLHCDGTDASTTFTDASSSAKGNATVNGNAQVDTAQSKFGGASLLLDGLGDYLEYISHADWNLEGTDFTIDYWIRWAADPADDVTIGAGNYAGTGWVNTLNGSGAFGIYDTGWKTLAWDPAADTWYHVAIVGSGGTGATVTIYINGVSQGTITDPDMNNDASALRIGGYTAAGIYGINGWMDEIRISNIARWTANFTPPASAYT